MICKSIPGFRSGFGFEFLVVGDEGFAVWTCGGLAFKFSWSCCVLLGVAWKLPAFRINNSPLVSLKDGSLHNVVPAWSLHD